MKKHFEFIDTAKGFGAFLVMLSHIDVTPKAYGLFMAPIFLSIFFYLSGVFLNANKYKNPVIFIKLKIFRLLIPWVVISYVSEIINISTIKKVINDPHTLFESFVSTTLRIIFGKAIWFVPCLMISLLITYLIFYFLNDQKLVIACSIAFFVIGIIFAKKNEYTIWSWNTALVNQLFVVIGALTGSKLMNKQEHIKRNSINYTIISLCVYSILLYVLYRNNYYSGFGIRLNLYDNIFSYLLLSILGIIFILILSITFPKIPLITFMGSHSLFYFAFGSHGYRIGRFLLITITEQFNSIKQSIMNPYVSSVFICIVASAFMGLLAILVDYFTPILNGKIKTGQFFSVFLRKIKNLKKVNNRI